MERESMVGLARWDGGGRGVIEGWHIMWREHIM